MKADCHVNITWDLVFFFFNFFTLFLGVNIDVMCMVVAINYRWCVCVNCEVKWGTFVSLRERERLSDDE